MKNLLRKGTYNPGRRPSEHNIGQRSFLQDNGGAIPPNVLVPRYNDAEFEVLDLLPIANTGTNDRYQVYCRQQGINPHPARMPEKLTEFFIQFLTDTGDLIMDPFAGSNTTGAVAERLKRRWLCIELEGEYVSASQVRVLDSIKHDHRIDDAIPHLQEPLPLTTHRTPAEHIEESDST
jgi:site-specific DNA-methyltransferase (cytosine-N4-specific)